MGKEVKRPLLCCSGSSQNAAWDCGPPGVNALNELCSSNSFPKMFRLSYIAYLHNLDAIYVCVCFSALVCVYAHTHPCRTAPEFSPTDSFDSYTCQWPDPGDNPPRCRHKANRKAPILPPDAGPRQGKQPQARLLTALSSFCPTNTWMGIQLILFHPGPFSQPAWHTERILCSSALPCVLHIRGRLIEREGKKEGIFIRKRINAQSALFGRYIRPIH